MKKKIKFISELYFRLNSD